MKSRLQISCPDTVCASLSLQGSKNGSLPCLAASLLHPGTVVLENVPEIEDVYVALRILRHLGAKVRMEQGRVTIRSESLDHTGIPAEEMRRMRSSVIFMGALLARCGQADIFYPGGCVIGRRPIDYHLRGMEELGCRITLEDEHIHGESDCLQGKEIWLPAPSVGATENLMLAAAGAEGWTTIHQAAKEPEVVELAVFLEKLGYQVRGAGTSSVSIRGRCSTCDVSYRLSGDRIAAGTWLLCCMNAGGELELRDAPVSWMGSTLCVLRQMGADIQVEKNRIRCHAPNRIRPVRYLETAPYPGFPTDMQSQFLAVLCRAEGNSCVCERIFSSRFQTAEELNRMGAGIRLCEEKNCVWLDGYRCLKGAEVTAPDLRGGAALVIAAMGAEGTTVIRQMEYMKRGYEKIAETICLLGGKACWLN